MKAPSQRGRGRDTKKKAAEVIAAQNAVCNRCEEIAERTKTLLDYRKISKRIKHRMSLYIYRKSRSGCWRLGWKVQVKSLLDRPKKVQARRSAVHNTSTLVLRRSLERLNISAA